MPAYCISYSVEADSPNFIQVQHTSSEIAAFSTSLDLFAGSTNRRVFTSAQTPIADESLRARCLGVRVCVSMYVCVSVVDDWKERQSKS